MVEGRGRNRPGVLVVEDCEPVMRQFCRSLSRAGFRTAAAEAIAETRAFLARGWDAGFVAVLLDLQLKDGDGEILLPDFAVLRPTPRIAVISGTADGPRAVALLKRGIPTIPKPIGGASLGLLVAQLMTRPELDDPVDSYCRARGLSPKETQVVRATAEGLTTAAVSEQVGCSLHTTTCYWQRIFDKTGHRSQPAVFAAIVRFAVEGWAKSGVERGP